MYFIFNGIDSRDLGIRLKDFPYDVMATKRVSELVLDRYDGTLFSTNNTFDSYVIDIECILLDNFKVDKIREIKDCFKEGVGEMVFSHKPNNIYKVRLINSLNFTEMLKYTGTCILSFKVEPFSYLKNGNEFISLSNNTKLNNLGNYFSNPIFKVNGKGNISIFINDIEMKFINVTKPFILDTQLEDIYGEDGENLNKFMDINSDFLALEEGENTIRFTGATIEIKPNWREL